MPTLSAVIVARNEADRIASCIGALGFCDEVLVVDGGSTDATPEIARALGARVISNEWPGFVAQKNFALGLATTDWVLSVDADELVDAKLAESVRAATGATGFDGYRVSRRNIWLGHRLRGGYAWPDVHTRLVRREKARWEGTDPHDRLAVDGALGDLAGELVHTSYRSLGDHLARVNAYTRVDARRGTAFDVLFRPTAHVFLALVARGGVRDGWAGLFYALLGGFYVALKWGRWRFDPEVASRLEAP